MSAYHPDYVFQDREFRRALGIGGHSSVFSVGPCPWLDGYTRVQTHDGRAYDFSNEEFDTRLGISGTLLIAFVDSKVSLSMERN